MYNPKIPLILARKPIISSVTLRFTLSFTRWISIIGTPERHMKHAKRKIV